MQILLTNFSDRAHREHSEMLELCRRKDAVSAAAFLRQHILNAEEALEAWHQTHQGKAAAAWRPDRPEPTSWAHCMTMPCHAYRSLMAATDSTTHFSSSLPTVSPP